MKVGSTYLPQSSHTMFGHVLTQSLPCCSSSLTCRRTQIACLEKRGQRNTSSQRRLLCFPPRMNKQEVKVAVIAAKMRWTLPLSTSQLFQCEQSKKKNKKTTVLAVGSWQDCVHPLCQSTGLLPCVCSFYFTCVSSFQGLHLDLLITWSPLIVIGFFVVVVGSCQFLQCVEYMRISRTTRQSATTGIEPLIFL